MKVVQIICPENTELDPESFCIWIAIPDDMIAKAIIPGGFEVTDTDYIVLVPGVDFTIEMEPLT